MSYLAEGWKYFSFLLTLEELQKVLEPYHLIIANAHVPIDYVKSDLIEYINNYRKLYEVLSSGQKLVWKKHCSLLDHINVASDLSKCQYGKVHEYEGKQYKSAEFLEPTVGIRPFALHFYEDSKGKLCTSTKYSYVTCAEEILGLQLYYPKKVWLKSEDHYELLSEAEVSGNGHDYENINRAITNMTKPLRIQMGEEKKSIGVRVSPMAKQDLAKFQSFVSRKIVVL